MSGASGEKGWRWRGVPLWYGHTLAAWLRLLVRHRFAVRPWRWPSAVLITLVASVNSLAALIQELVFGRRIREEPIPPPVFVIGHWRSGTTFMHELLATDPRFLFPTTFECFSPKHFMLSSRPITKLPFLLPSKRPMDDVPVGWWLPQEDEFALMAMSVGSPYEAFGFPRDREPSETDVDPARRDAPGREAWERALRTFLQRVSVQRRRERKRKKVEPPEPAWYLLKSPTHTARIALLARMFPEARFVHMTRDPRALYASSLRLWRKMAEAEALGEIEPAGARPLEDVVPQMMALLYRGFAEARDALPPGRFIEIRYDELMADPAGCMDRVFAELGLGAPAPDRAVLDALLARHHGHRPNRHPSAPLAAAATAGPVRAYAEAFGYPLEAREVGKDG